MERKNYKISQEVSKFPYNGNFEKNDNEMFSEKFCCCTIKIRKKIIKGIRWSIFHLEVSVSVANGVIPFSSNWVSNSATDSCDYEIYSFKC